MPKPATILPSPTPPGRMKAVPIGVPAWCGIFLALFFLLLLAGRSNLIRDPGVFWHTAFGERIISGSGIPRVDMHSLTHAGETWLDLQWLGECVMALAYRIGGWDTLLLAGVTALAATYTWLARRFLQAGMHAFAVGVILAAVLAASSHHFHVRPHLASIAFLGLTVALLVDVDRSRASLRRLLWLPPLFAVWANVHGGVLGGVATVAIAAAAWLGLGFFRHKTSPGIDGGLPGSATGSRTSLRPGTAAVAILFACSGALLVTPHGWQGVVTCINLMRMPLPDVIQEHRPLHLLRVEGIATLLLGAAYFAALKSAGARNLKATWLLPLPWLVLALLRVRHAPLFAITWGVVMADVLRYTRLPAKLAEHGLWSVDAQPSRTRKNRQGIAIISLLLLLAIALQAASISAPLIGHGWADLKKAGWPMELRDDLAKLETEFDRPIKIFNQLHFGGFIIFHHPQARIFIDDRCELYGFEMLSAYAAAETHQPERIRGWHQQHRFDGALVAAGSPFDEFLAAEPGWRAVARSPQATLYEPCGPTGVTHPEDEFLPAATDPKVSK